MNIHNINTTNNIFTLKEILYLTVHFSINIITTVYTHHQLHRYRISQYAFNNRKITNYMLSHFLLGKYAQVLL